MSEKLGNAFRSDEEKRRILAERFLAQRKAALGSGALGTEMVDPAAHIDSVSYAQERMWFLHEMNPTSAAYTITTAYHLRGALKIDCLRDALRALMARHEMLRSSFHANGAKPCLRVHESLPPELRITDVVPSTGAALDAFLARRIHEETCRPFDISVAPLFRATFLNLGKREGVLIFTFHHIVADGWSLGVFNHDLGLAYTAAASGQVADLPPTTLSQDQVVKRESSRLKSASGQTQLEYWATRLHNLPTLELPMARSRPPVARFIGSRHEEHLDEDLIERLEGIARENGSTLYMVAAAVFAILLHRYSGQEDIVFGSPVAGRTDPETEDLIGLFVNTVVLRIDLTGGLSFTEVVQRVREASLDALQNQSVPFERVVERLAPQRTLSHNPLFQVMFALQNFRVEPPDLLGLVVTPISPPEANVRFDLECTLWRRAVGATVRFVYNTDIIDQPTAARLSSHFIALLKAFADDSLIPIADVPLLTREERRIVEEQERGPALEGDTVCLHELYERVAEARPAAPALRDDTVTLSFQQLDLRANQIANALLERNAHVGEIVGVCLPRTVDLVAAILGVAKAGCAFLPLNPADPTERLDFILRDAGVRLVVSSLDALAAQRIGDAECVDIPQVYERLDSFRADVPVGPTDPVYAIYTSGTTGRPKGVLLEHRNLTSTLRACQQHYRFTEDDYGLVLASSTFDVFYYELFAPLLAGGCSRLVDREELFDPERLATLVRQATCFQAVPGLMEQVLAALRDQGIDTCPRMRCVITGGDLVPPALLDTLHRVFPQTLVSITYGPTETAIFCTAYNAPRGLLAKGHPIGKALPGAVVRIGDTRGMPLPEGVDGEIWIGGQGVCRGYLNRPQETSARFVTIAGGRFYRSGDRGRRTADGGIEFLGRADRQVKIRGFRIELGEVEAVLSEAPGVARAIAVDSGETPSGRFLAAYVVLDDAVLHQSAHDGISNVERWRTLFDSVYDSRVRLVSGDNDFTGWNSSYTGDSIPVEQMEDWLGGTLAQVRSRVPPLLLSQQRLRVLEIGCGTGLVLLNLAPQCARYVACDFSARALADLREKIEHRGLSQIELHHTWADCLDVVEDDFNVVVINSVSQYFPDEAYLRRVLESALAHTRLGGFVFVGDVRSLPLLITFRVAVEVAKAPSRPAAELLTRAIQRATQEEELLIHPMFFTQFAAEVGSVSHVEAEPRRGQYSNEMTRYRYDVVLHRGKSGATKDAKWHRWSDESWDLKRLGDHLVAAQPETLALLEIPNALIQPDIGLHAELARSADGDGPRVPNGSPTSPDEVRALAEVTGYRVSLSCLRGASDGTFDAYFLRADVSQAAQPTWPMPGQQTGTSFVGSPLRRAASLRATKLIRDFVAGRLPEYMVPSTLIAIESLPLTSNGKVDRAGLPSVASVQKEASRQPCSDGERLVAQTWATVLGSEPSATDDFFESGGTSLLALQFAVGLRAHGVRFTPQQVFELRTVERIGALIEAQLTERPLVHDTPSAEEATDDAPGAPLISRRRHAVPVLLRDSACCEPTGNVLLTGATGMLGVHLLQEILQQYQTRVICPVRGADDVAAAERLRDQFSWYFPGTDLQRFSERVTAVAADLRLPKLGVTAALWDSLAERCRHVIHAAADVRHVASPEEVFATNVNGTRHLLELAVARPDVRFHYISSIGIKGVVSGLMDEVVLTEQDFDVGQHATEPYSESKMQAERDVRDFLHSGGSGAIYRIGTVAPHSVTGRFQRNIDGHFFSRFLRSILEIGVLADWPERRFALLPVDLLAQAILALSGREEALGQTFHLENAYQLSPANLADTLRVLGYPIQLIDPERFDEIVTALGRDQRNAEVVSRLLPVLERRPGRHVRLDASWTVEWLKQLGISFPPSRKSWFAAFIKHGIERGYFPAPPSGI